MLLTNQEKSVKQFVFFLPSLQEAVLELVLLAFVTMFLKILKLMLWLQSKKSHNL